MHARRTRSIVQRGRPIYRDVAHNAGRQAQPFDLQITWLRLQYCLCYRLVELPSDLAYGHARAGEGCKFEALKLAGAESGRWADVCLRKLHDSASDFSVCMSRTSPAARNQHTILASVVACRR